MNDKLSLDSAPVATELRRKFEQRQATVAVIGLGYVGLPLAAAFAKAGYQVIGIEVSAEKVAAVNAGQSYVGDVASEELRRYVRQARQSAARIAMVGSAGDNGHAPLPEEASDQGSITATTDYGALARCDAVSICVPTPLNKTGEPDISYIVASGEQIARHLHSGMVIVLESTTYPGTTTEVLLPTLLEQNPGFEVGKNLFVAFSPERIDPGRADWTVETMPKVMGGVTPACLEIASAFYGPAVGPLVPVSSPNAAEMVKLFENTFRSVNVALANELLLMCDKLGLDAWEIVDAAATKPFGFMKFTPGPGLGGHCLPIDPHYLSWKLRSLDYKAQFIELASEINTAMPRYWVQQVQDLLNERGLPLRGSHVLVLGVAYKKDVDDVRESPALDMIHLLRQKGADVTFHDPFVADIEVAGERLNRAADFWHCVDEADCVLIATDHTVYDWPMLRRRAASIMDTRHVI